jgi:hydrogenase expression/formation protein HypD
MGYEEYEPIAAQYGVPIVVTGFEPLDILEGIYCCVRQLEAGRAVVENQYSRVVRRQGNRAAQAMIAEVFCVVARRWRGMGELPASGLAIAPAYADYDAQQRFGPVLEKQEHSGECISARVLRGDCKPTACAAFGTRCTPENPLGVTMVSSEGACAAYYRFRGPRCATGTCP